MGEGGRMNRGGGIVAPADNAVTNLHLSTTEPAPLNHLHGPYWAEKLKKTEDVGMLHNICPALLAERSIFCVLYLLFIAPFFVAS